MICKQCQTEFKPNKMKTQLFCGWECFRTSQQKPKRYCKECNQELTKKWSISFCGNSCAASYNNKNKKTGTRRSKLEKYIEKELLAEFTKEEIVFNSKEIIGSELDIYFPKLKLAFEINGVFHYRPIYGEDKFKRIQELAEEKRIKCQDKNITLVEIDTRDQLQFNESKSKVFVDEIVRRVDERLKSAPC